MKFNQLETNETIFFILEPNDELDSPVSVAFDDADTARSYLNRFNTFSDAQIVECRLNPGFYTDITKDCYFIQLDIHRDVYTISLANDLHRSELAFNSHYYFEAEQFCVYLMGASSNEALKTARKIRDQVIDVSNVNIQSYNVGT